MTFRPIAAAVFIAAFVATAASAQEPPVDLGAWSYETLAPGWPATALIGNAVFGEDDVELGTVEDIAINATSTIDAVTIAADGTHYAVPWAALDYDPVADSATLPVGAGEIDRYQPVREQALNGVQNRADAFLASQLIEQELAITDESSYGRVQDLIFDLDGTLEALVIAPAGDPDKRIALPWRAVRLDPEGGLLTAPYDAATLDRLPRFSVGEILSAG